MTIIVQLSAVGINITLFDIYSNIDYVTPIVTGISKMQLLAGYSLLNVPDNATTIRLSSTGTCSTYTDIAIGGLITTTTTSTTAIPTTTTTSTTLNCSFIVNAQEITTTTTTTQAPSPYRCIKVDGCDGLGYRSIPFNSSTAMVGDVIPYYVVADPNTILCGTVVDINYISFADSFGAVGNPIVCGDETYCNIPNPFPP